MLTFFNIITDNEPQNNSLQDEVSDAVRQQFLHDWEMELNRVHAKRGQGLNKLRTYKLFKHEYGTDSYVDIVYQTCQRSAMARFRCGIAPINIELGRYVNVPADQRFCHFCIDDKVQTIVRCPMYTKVRNELFTQATYFKNDFMQMTDIDKLIFSSRRHRR